MLLMVVNGSLLTHAHIRLPKIFGPNMVLQQGRQNKIWGWANKGEHIALTLAGWSFNTIADDKGKWTAELPSLKYGGPYKLVIKGENRIELTNIMIGEVWVCSGQSNMELPVSASLNAAKEIDSAQYPKIRIFTVPQRLSQFPKNDLDQGEWTECSPATIAKFSATAYYFGRYLYQKLKVPIGLVNSSYGGTLIESWTSGQTIQNDPDLKEPLRKLLAMDLPKLRQERVERIKKIIGELPENEIGIENGKPPLFAAADLDDSEWKMIRVPGFWGNNGYPDINGVGWYRKKIDLSDEQARQDITLHLSKLYHGDTTWINGQRVGSMDPSNDERIYKVAPGVLKRGSNVIAIRIVSNNGGAGFNSKPYDVYIETSTGKIPLAGDWKFKIAKVVLNDITTFRNSYPTMLYNAMINPIIPFGIRGVIWYQGESNAQDKRSVQYRRLFPNLIADWRKLWGQGDFPFLFVSIANYCDPADIGGENYWAELREAQTMALKVPNTGMAVAIDLGEANNIHPRNKQEVGRRLALKALSIAYHKNVVCTSPMYRAISVTGKQVQVTFDGVGSGLRTKGPSDVIYGFTIAGSDQKFYPARAKLINDRTVSVEADQVSAPVAVRYAWADDPGELNLYNKEDLPANPFRTDNWSFASEANKKPTDIK